MSKNKFDRRFFESTRGRIVSLLHGSNKTVNELAEALGLSDNAVRAHLLTLERDQLVMQAGMVKGFRKPHFTYGLGPEARLFFPRSYDALFNQFLSVLKTSLSPRAVKKALSEVGRKFGMRVGGSESFDGRLEQALAALKELGGAAAIVKDNSKVMIKSDSCPFAEAVAEHPEVCKVAESMVGEIVDRKVVERCDRTALPKCCFEIGVT